MNLIDRFSEILRESELLAENIKASKFTISEEINCVEGGNNLLALGDNAQFMKYLLTEKDMAGKLKMIYIDPPFFSKATYDAVIHFASVGDKKPAPIKYFAYDDVWKHDMAEYLKMICCRLILMKELLADDGTIWVHLDWHVVHYVKIFMDAIFGEDNFVNEIIWHYKSGGSGKKHFSRKHDTILVYSKTKKYYFAPDKEKSYNRGFKPYRFKGVKEYKDDLGWYTMVTMKDVWNVDMVGRTSSERTGYATQKPEALISRMISGATKEGDLCADFFCGSGTLAAAAEKMNRRWICCDGSPLAISASLKRLDHCYTHVQVMGDEAADIDRAACKVEISVEREEIAGSDKKLLDISLKSYQLSSIPESMDKKGRETVEFVQQNDSIQMIEYWSVDFDYDGKIFRPEMIFSKEKGRVKASCQKLTDADKDCKICVKTVDVFGNHTLTII